MIMKLFEKKFYGVVEIYFSGGEITHIKKIESIKI